MDSEPLTKGEQTRAAILNESGCLATVVGLEGLSIGGLASATGMSKSGLYAHFGSKLELQLATVDAAREAFIAEVLQPALAWPKGLQRLLAVCDCFLSYVERRVFPGGCFFVAAAADAGSRTGPLRETIAEQQRQWGKVLERLARESIENDELEPGTEPALLAFELQALLAGANNTFILQDDATSLEMAQVAIRERLGIAV